MLEPPVGRSVELAAWNNALLALTGGARAAPDRTAAAHAITVAGDPGTGKSRLLDCFVTAARRRGVTVAAAQGADSTGHLGTLVELLDDLVAAQRERVLAALDEYSVRLLAPLLRTPDSSDRHQASGPELAAAVRRLLTVLAEPAGLVLAVDDIHRADPGSAAVLEHLLRRPSSAPVLMSLTYRPRQAAARFLTVLAAGRQREEVLSMTLGPLSRRSVEHILGAEPCPRHRALAHQECDGNPRYLELVRSACAAGRSCDVDLFTGLAELVAAGAAAPLLAELDQLSAPAHAVARAAAVVGCPFDPELVAQVAELPEPVVLGSIDQLLTADLVRQAPGVNAFHFRHPFMRGAIYWATAGGWRLGAHSRAAAALRARGAPVADYADHVEQVAWSGDEDSVAVLTSAARMLESRSPANAARWYAAAVRMLPEQTQHRAHRAALLTAVASTSILSGQLARGEAAIAQHHHVTDPATGEATEVIDTAGITEWSGLALQLRGRYAESRRLLRGAVLRAPDRNGDDGPARLRVALAATAVWDGAAGAGDFWSDDALLAAVGTGDLLLQAHALGVRALVRLADGDVGAATALATTAARIADQQTDDAVAERLAVLTNLAWAEARLEQYGLAVRHFTRALAVSQRTGQLLAAALLRIGLGTTYLQLGQLCGASAEADHARRLAESIGSEELLVMAVTLQVNVGAVTASLDPALVDKLTSLLRSLPPDCPAWRSGKVTLAAVQLAAGDPGECVKTVVEAGDGLALMALPPPVRVGALELLTRALLAQDRSGAAREIAREAQSVAGGLGLRGAATAAGLAQAAAAESPEMMLVWGNAAAENSRRAGHLIQLGQTHLVMARAQLELGRPAIAETELQAASDLALRTGAGQLAAAVADLRGELPPPPADPDEPPQNLDALSPREREVALLVGAGRTNRQIARALGVSHKTIETHLGRIFSKLAVSSRAEIASMVGHAQGRADAIGGNGRVPDPSHHGEAPATVQSGVLRIQASAHPVPH